ncbi:MAG TPA: hypothetical protein VLF94_04425 [Chlamydiales bacterium]|nr:hypothetical protein [Chlamydiales bacterium]
MSTNPVASVAPIVIAMSNITTRSDLLGNEVIDSVIQVFFPAMENLTRTLEWIERSSPAQVKVYRQSNIGNIAAAAEMALFAIGVEATKQTVAALEYQPGSVSDSGTSFGSSSHVEVGPQLFPTIVTISELSQKKWEGIPVVETVLSIYLPTMRNVIATEKMILKEDPKTKFQTHFKSDQTNVQDVANFMIHAIAEQGARERRKPISASASALPLLEDHFGAKTSSSATYEQ